MFRDDLCAVLKQWRLQGDRIVLMMDANDNVLNGHIAKALAKDGIELKEAVHAQTPGYGPKTHFRGSQLIDGIWYTPDLELMGASYLPFDADMGDHRPVMADFTEQSLLGVNLPNIVPPDGRRLNCKIERIRTRYIEDLEAKFERHNILERLKKISKEASYPISAEAAEALEKIDLEVTKLMLSAEKKCRKMYTKHYEFSPPIKRWMDRCHAYRALIRLEKKFLEAKSRKPWKVNMNVSNVYRAAERCGIWEPKELRLAQLYPLYSECREHAKTMMAEAPAFRKMFLSDRLSEAMGKKQTEEAKRIKAIIKGEANRKEWQGIQRVVKPNKAGAVTFVDVPLPDGTIKRCSNKYDMEEAIGESIMDRSTQADSAPICQGALFDLLGYGADTETAVEILEGTFVAPEGTDRYT